MTHLFTEHDGSGPSLLLLHGWALHSGVFDGLTGRLASRYAVTRADLPGHGRSPLLGGLKSIDSLATAVAQVRVQPGAVLGWSLGGLAALALAARHPHLVSRLILVATTPSFVNRPGADPWRLGVSDGFLDGFSAELASNFQETVVRFLSLQTRGDEHGAATLRDLRARVFARGRPDPGALTKGLSLLRHTDLRRDLAHVAAPTLVVCGSHDRLTRPAASRWLAERLPSARLVEIDGAGHAPFLSHPQEFDAAVDAFMAST